MARYRQDLHEHVVRIEDGLVIPNDPRNRDRQEFEVWLSEGGTPDPYIAPTPPEPAPEYVTREQFDALAKELAALRKV